MKRRLLEGSVLFVSIVKWVFLASCVGVVVGLSTAAFLYVLQKGIDVTSKQPYFFLLLPVSFVVSTALVKYLAPEAKGHGTEKVIEAVHKRSGKIDPRVVPVKLLATVITIATGGSAGKEGPCAQIGAGLSSLLADLLRFDDSDRKKLVICGISAGFSTVFGTPIAGAIFGVEVLFVGSLMYDVLLPSFVAGIVGFQVSSALGVKYFHEAVNFLPDFTPVYFIRVCIAGVFFGLCALGFIEMLRFFGCLRKRLRWSEIPVALLGGATLAVLALLCSRRYLGLGLETISSALGGQPTPLSASFMKMLFTSVTLTFGGSGGIVTPIFFIGATAGNAFASVAGMSPSVFSAIGMVSLLAGAANTPISASIMAVEIFGPPIAPYAAVACVISFLMTGYRSVYPSQVLNVEKSSSISVEKGQEMRNIQGVDYHPHKGSVASWIAGKFNRG